MSVAAEIASWVLLMAGSAFMLIGGLGLLRLPDFFSRLHPASLTDTGGAGLILLGLMLQAGFTLVTAKLVLILFFIFLTSPTAAHATARAALAAGMRPILTDRNDEAEKPSKS